MYNVTKCSLLGFGNKGTAGWGCAQHHESQQQQLRLGMVGCLRRPSCTSAMGDQRHFCTVCSPTSHIAQHDPQPPATYCKQKPQRNHIITGVGECQEVIILFFLPWYRGQSTCTQYPSDWGPPKLLLFHCTPPTATFPDRKPEALVIKTPRARTGLKRAKQMPGTGRACCFTEAFLQAGSVLAHAAGGILLCLIALKTGAVEGEEKRPVKCVYV